MPYKVMNRFCYSSKVLTIFLIINSCYSKSTAQAGRPPVTTKYSEYKEQVKRDTLKKMIELKSRIPGIVYDLRYATVNNFMKRMMYPAGTKATYLRQPAAAALQKIQTELSQKNLGLKIYDAYRPYSVTVKFWELVRDERYVANPKNGSGHNRGIAVDLTLINKKTGVELHMGTGFDNFSDTAHHSFSQLPKETLNNRVFLKTIMIKYGFKPYENEWWHYSWPDAPRFEILDIDFKKLKK